MPSITPIINNFSGGELATDLDARNDLKKYYSGCRTLKNFLITPYGGAVRRPGTYFVAETKHSEDSEDKKSRLFPFEYNVEQAYMLEFGEKYIRFFTDDGQIITGYGTEDLSGFTDIIGHWLLNDNDASQTVLDADGATHNGATATNNTEDLHKVGKVGTGSLDLAGIDAIEITNHTDFNFGDGADDTAFSIAAWINVVKTDSRQVVMSKWKAGVDRQYRLSIDELQKLELALCDDSAGIDTNLTGHWKMNDDAESKVVVDDSTETNDGTSIQNTDDITTTGKVNAALTFNGTSDKISIGDGSEYNFERTDSFSFAFWAKPTSGSGQQYTIATNYKLIGGTDRGYAISCGDGRVGVALMNGWSTRNMLHVQAPSSITDDMWNFVVVTYDGSSDASGINIYVNGVLVDIDTTYDALTATIVTGEVLTIGARAYGNYFYKGVIDNFMVFERELSQSDVTVLYNSNSGTETLSMVMPYKKTDVALEPGWHFVVATYPGQTDTPGTAASLIKLYVDNVLVDSTAYENAQYTAMEVTTIKPRIGAQIDGSDALQYVWANKIDNVILFGKELSAANVSTLYNSGACEVSSPYLEADLFDLHFVQSADVLYIVHPNYIPRKLNRYSHDDWTLEEIDFTWGPFLDNNITDITITPSAVIGNGITLTASSAIFSSGHVGSIWKIAHKKVANSSSQHGEITDATAGSAINLKNVCRFRTVDAGNKDTEYKIQRKYSDDADYHDFKVLRGAVNYDIQWNEPNKDGALYKINCTAFDNTGPSYTLSCEQYYDVGYVKVTGFTSSTVVIADVVQDLGSIDATKLWAEGAWSDYRGWPRTLDFFESRLTFGANAYNPLTLWYGETNNFEGMRAKTLAENDNYADESLIFTISSGQQNMIKWISAQDALLIGTAGTEGKLSSYNRTQPITPENIPEYRVQSSYGSSDIQSILVNDSVLFVQRENKKIRELKYDFESNLFVARDLTIYSKHITGDGIVQIAHQKQPDSILWAIRSDGDIGAMLYERLENIYGWFKVVTDGDFESVGVISSAGQSSLNEDEVWFIINRTIGGSTKRFIEYMKPRNWGITDTDVFFVDSGLSAAGSGGETYVGGLDHLEGETVDVLIDGKVGDQQVVGEGKEVEGEGTTGYIDLEIGGVATASTTKVHVGLNYESELKPMKVSIALGQDNTSRGRMKRIHEAVILFKDTLGGSFGRDSSNMDELDHAVTGTDGSMTPLKTQEETVSWPGIDETYGDIIIKQTNPLPMSVLGVIPKLDISEV